MTRLDQVKHVVRSEYFLQFSIFSEKKWPIDKQHIFCCVPKKNMVRFLRELVQCLKKVGIGGRFFQFGMLKL